MNPDEFMATVNEPLHPDLEGWVEEGVLGRQLRHPLVYAIPLAHTGLANKTYRGKAKALEQAREEGDAYAFVYLHERPYRLGALVEVMTWSERVDWGLVRSVWIDSENIWQNFNEWKELLTLPEARDMMTEDERAAWAALPETVTIYRGCQRGLNEDGLSYTVNFERAEWFAARFSDSNEESVIVEATVPRDKIVAHFLGRGEEEVIVHDEDVTILRYHEVS